MVECIIFDKIELDQDSMKAQEHFSEEVAVISISKMWEFSAHCIIAI